MTTQREPIGHDWLAEFREKFAEEFPDDPEDAMAQRAIERGVGLDRKQVARPGRSA
ncbi:hypothetical protein ACFFP0_24725 [Rhizobium puerariae]|uniref:Uncharacterized protein n=1 Tax=Rhizobium puerariae TaxID=1585791 RepID=A0ABV6AN76_9HYPH